MIGLGSIRMTLGRQTLDEMSCLRRDLIWEERRQRLAQSRDALERALCGNRNSRPSSMVVLGLRSGAVEDS
jgi:hypothetical protein